LKEGKPAMNFDCEGYGYERFMDSLASGKELVLFGASSCALKTIRDEKIDKIKYFVDNDEKKYDKNGEGDLLGIKIYPPQKLLNDKGRIVILITSEFDYEIKKQLKEMGITDDIYSYRMFSQILYESEDIRDPFHRRPPLSPRLELLRKINGKTDNINKVLDILADAKSKSVFSEVIHNRKYSYNNYDNALKYSVEDVQYFPDDIMVLGENEVFVDAGVYDGGTSIHFMKRVKDKFRMIYAFEPDRMNYELSKINLKSVIEEGKLKLFDKGLYDENKKIGFCESGGNGSHIVTSSEAASTISVVSLDSAVDDDVTFIKMDIEGAEQNALKGMIKTIKKCRPKLVVCLYHSLEDLWEIPLWMADNIEDYKYYIRHHARIECETVLYAIPE
jgi:FkbM family methyltransferase